MKNKKYPLIKPQVDFAEISGDIKKILSSGILTNGDYVKEFEREIALYTGTEFAFATTSCTTGLHLILEAMEIGDGDEVLVSDFSFPASGNVVVEAGAKPVFIDCKPGEYILDLKDAKKKLTKKTKAIMVVDPFGQPGDLENADKFARANNLYMIEDSACAIGSAVKNKKCGNFGDAGCFSFHPRKVITTGEGGAITTSNRKLAERIAILRSHGGVKEGHYFKYIYNGYNYRMTEIQGAMGLQQMRQLKTIIAERKRIGLLYKKYLKKLKDIKIPQSISDKEWNFQSFVILLPKRVNRNKVITELKKKNIEATLGTYAMHAQESFAKYGYKPGDLPNSYNNQRQTLTLPLFSGMTESDVKYIAAELNKAIAAG